MIFSFLMVLSRLFLPSNEPSTLTIRFENIRHTEGYMFVGIYEKADSWKARLPEREINFEKHDLVNGTLTVTISDLKPGTYGLAVLDDANANNVVDMGLIFPLEGFGFSNLDVRGFRVPDFEDFDFSYPQQKNIVVKMRYLDF